MAIAVRNTTTKANGGTTTAVLNKPAGVVSGDVLYFFGADASQAITAPSWTQVAFEATNKLTSLRLVAGGSEPSTYTFTGSTNGLFESCIVALSGVDNVSPEDATGTTNNGTGTTATAPTITTVTDNAWWLVMFDSGSGTALSLPAGFSSPADVVNLTDTGDVMEICHKLISPPGATGTANSTITGTGTPWSTISLAARPAATGGGAFVPAFNQSQIWAQIMVAGTRTRVRSHSGGSTYARQVTTWFRAQPRRPITAGSAAQSFSQTLSVTTTTTVTVLKQIGKLLGVTSTAGVALFKQVGKLLAVTMTATVALAATKLKLVILAVTMTAVVSINRQIGKLVAVTSTTMPAIVRQVQKRFSVTATTVPALLKSIAKTLSVSAVTAPVLNALKVVGAPALAVIAILISRDGRAALRARSGVSPLLARAGGAILQARNMIAKLLARSGRP